MSEEAKDEFPAEFSRLSISSVLLSHWWIVDSKNAGNLKANSKYSNSVYIAKEKSYTRGLTLHLLRCYHGHQAVLRACSKMDALQMSSIAN